MGDLVSDISGAKFCFTGENMVKVLIIEDDSSARLVTKLHLRNEYQVVEAANGTVKASVSRFDNCRCYDAKDEWL